MKKNKNEYKVLVLEDELVIQEEIVEMLRDLGYTVSDTATSFDEAIAASEKVFPDIALCDINIRGYKDGIMAAEKLSKIASEYNLTLIIVYLTAYDDPDLVERALHTKPGDFMLKSSLNEVSLDARLQIAIKNVEHLTGNEVPILDDRYVNVLVKGIVYKIDTKTVLYLEANGNGCILYTEESIFKINQMFGVVVKQFQPYGIRKVHRSSAVNIKKVKAYDPGLTFVEINLRDLKGELKSEVERTINISGSYRNELKEILNLK